MTEYQLRIIGTGNAWPILVSEDHPFYDMNSDSELANAAYLLTRNQANKMAESVLVDAGFGVIPYLLRHANRIPEAVILTHAHLDHTVSLDWIVHSYFKKYHKKKRLPLYCSNLCYKTLITSFPQIEDKLEFKPLLTGLPVNIGEMEGLEITAYPVFHGNPARGARMLKINIGGNNKILFTGDCLSPLLRMKDIEELKNIPFLIADANNRFPYPGSNHWSILPHPPEKYEDQSYLEEYRSSFSPSEVLSTQLEPFSDESTLDYFDEWLKEKAFYYPVLSISDFCNIISPDLTLLVHYGGGEDEKYYESRRLSKNELQEWVDNLKNISTKFTVPLPGDIISLI